MRDYQIHCPQCAALNFASEERCTVCGARLRAPRRAVGRAGLPPLVSPSGRPMPEFEDVPPAAPPAPEPPAPSPLQAPPPAAAEKYPHLRRRLKWMRFAAEHTLFLFLAVGLLTAAAPFFIPLPGPSWLRFLGIPLGLLSGVPGWFLYLYQRTQIDLIEVLLDTEETTRRLAEWLVQRGPEETTDPE
jgi:hypothetical protein